MDMKLRCVRSFCSYLSLSLLGGDFSINLDLYFLNEATLRVWPSRVLSKVNYTSQPLTDIGREGTDLSASLSSSAKGHVGVVFQKPSNKVHAARTKLSIAHKIKF